MIDRRRDLLADRIHELIIGHIDYDQFEDALRVAGLSPFMKPAADRALLPICEASWCLYSDSRPVYRLIGKDKLKQETRRLVLGWILFLRADHPYEWPVHHLLNPIFYARGCLMTILTLGLWPRRQRSKFKQAGDFDVWPFLRRADYEATAAAFCHFKPRLALKA